MNINDDIYDRQIDHTAMSRKYEESVQVETRRIIKRHKSRLRSLLAQSKNLSWSRIRDTEIEPEVRRFTKELDNKLVEANKDFSMNEIDFNVNNLNKSLGRYATIRSPSATRVLAEVVGVNVRGDGNLSRKIQGIGANELTRIKGKISLGISEGWSNKRIVDEIVRTTRLTESQASALVRTSITRTQSVSQLATFQENAAILKGMRFTAVLDSRTSVICAHHDGNIYDINDTRFVPPLHWRCRSTLIPVSKSLDELLESKDPSIKKRTLEALGPEKVKKFSGQGPKRETYGQWLSRQPRETKLRHFEGDSQKVDLFDSGHLSLDKFSTASGKSLSLQALRRLDNRNTSVVPVRQKALNPKVVNNLAINAARPSTLIRNKSVENELRTFFRAEAVNLSSVLSLTDFRGTSLAGKRASRRRANNEFDERNVGFDPLTGEQKSTLIYDPDFQVLQERIDFLNQSKILNKSQKEWIRNFAESLENDGLSVNQQAAVVENLRVVFERFNKDKTPWVNLNAVLKAELNNSVVNVSRILDRRSRARSEIFKFGATPGESQVQILGEWVSFSTMSKNTLTNQRYIDNFTATHGLPLARKLYLSGRSPLRTYFPKGPDNIPSKDKVKKSILKKIEKLPFGKAFVKRWKGEPSDTVLTSFLQSGQERLRRFLDLEWFYVRKRDDFIQRNLTPEFAQKRIKLLAEIVADIATGESTDYDLLAIKIGKKIYEAEKSDFDIFFRAPTVSNYHKIGSDVLTGLKDQGIIKIGLRGITRRGVNDLESGRPQIGSYRDTISREVQIIDPEMLRLQRAKRELVYSRRIGIVNPRDRLIVKTGSKNFYDSRGRRTSQSVVTRRASGNYDQNLIDKDFSRMLNHAMSFEWEVDPDFGSFFEDLAYFRDPRGNVKYYDELNGFRKIIIQRGEMGMGLIQSIRWHRQNKNSWTNWAQIDGRGRLYTQGYLHPAGGEFVRPFLNTKIAKNISPEILDELKIQIGALTGEAFSVLTNEGRMRAFKQNEKAMLEIGRIIMSKTQRDRRIRDFLEHPLVRATEPEEVPKLARLALEYTRIYDHVDGDFSNVAKLRTYKTQLSNENDASASGAQIIALSTRDRALGEASNVVATTRKNRLYDLVAERTMSDPEFQEIAAFADLSFGDLAKGAKGQSMVAFYGAGQATQAGAIEGKLAKVLAEKDFTVITAPQLREFNKNLDRAIDYAKREDATSVALSLQQLKTEVNYSINNNVPVGNQLIAHARDVHPDSEEFVRRLTNVRGGIVGPAQFKSVARIMSKHLRDIAPITENFVSFWKQVADVYITESKKVDIPWITVDGKLLYQRYRPTVQERIEFVDPVTGRKVANIYEDSITDSKFLGRSSIISARSGLGVNGNHMNDASIVRKFHLWGRKNNINTATIHDGFFTNLADSIDAKFALREIYADAIEGETIVRTLKQMRKEGLSQESYEYFLNQAKELGLINPINKLTKEDLLAEIREDEDWYGIGP